MSVEPLRSVRDHLSEVIEQVEKQHGRVTITRNGRAAAASISTNYLAELEEPLQYSLTRPRWRTPEADRRYGRGEVLRGVDAFAT